MASSRGGSIEVAVIGSGGFLGSHLVRRLKNSDVATGSFTRSRPALKDGILNKDVAGAQVIYYLATSATPGVAERTPQLMSDDHASLLEFLTALRQLKNHRPTVVFCSSSTVYDSTADAPYRETTPVRAETAFGAGKLNMERSLLQYSNVVRPIVIRLGSMYGPGHRTDPGHGVIMHWLSAISAGRPIDVIGGDETRRDFIYIDDVVDALVRLISTPIDGIPYLINIGSGEPTSLGELLRGVIKATGERPLVRRHPARGFDRREIWLDIGLASETLGWVPQTDLLDGLTHTWRSIVGCIRESGSVPEQS